MSFVLEYGVCQIAGPDPQAYPSWARMGGFQIPIFDAHLESSRLVLMAVAALLMFALAMYIGMTREGRAMRAIALDQKAATLMGVNVNKTISMVFFIGSALAGAAGVMAASQFGVVTFLMGFLIGIKAFTAAVIGGIGNLYGAMLGGLSLGLLENLGSFWLGGEWKDVFAFVFLILFLTLKPTGILGERVVERM
jgi:branched-chain amino acid transport system permease protein